MVIESIEIEKFRAMNSLNLNVGKRITVIAGRNATMKSTLLGMLGQPFSISKENPLFGCKSIDGYDFKSQFQDKFKLSQVHDIVGQHVWTLHLANASYYKNNYIKIKSIARKQKGKPDTIRFWNAESRAKGAGYIQLPVMYLSLSRLYPVGESGKTITVPTDFTEDEIKLYVKWYKEILSIQTVNNPKVELEKKDSKIIFTGISDDVHDIFTSSAGEGNIGRILLAILSFKRLKEQYGKDYKAGILLIDELDATLYGFAQKKLVRFLYDIALEYKLQIIFTTHSPLILKEVSNLQREEIIKKRIDPEKVAYKYECEIIDLRPKYDDEGVRMIDGKNIHTVQELTKVINEIHMRSTVINQNIRVYFEDSRALNLMKYIFNKFANVQIQDYAELIDVNLGWTNYVQLHQKGIREFRDSIIVLDCDVQNKTKEREKLEYIRSNTENILYSPVDVEAGLFTFLKNHAIYNELETILNSRKIYFDFDSCFNSWPENIYDSNEYKRWFKHLEESIGDIDIVLDLWCEKNEISCKEFIVEFIKAYNKIAERQELDYIISQEEALENNQDNE